MPVEWRYRGRAVTAEDIVFIRQFIADNPSMSRRKLSAQLCEAWQWKQANGCLVRYGLPWSSADAVPRRRDRTARDSSDLAQSFYTKKQTATDSDRHDAAERRLASASGPISLPNRSEEHPRNRCSTASIEHHHYLGYEQPVGEHLKYLVWTQERPIACTAVEFGASPSGQPGSSYRLVCRSSKAQHPLHRIQHEVPDSAPGVRRCRTLPRTFSLDA